MLIFPALSLIPRSCSLLSSPSELLWFPGGAMFFLISRSHPSIPPLSDILATPPGPTVQPALICNLCISFLVLAPFFGGDSHSLCCHSALYIPGHSFTMLSYKCLCTQLHLWTHCKLPREGACHLMHSCICPNPSGNLLLYICNMYSNKLSIQSNSI